MPGSEPPFPPVRGPAPWPAPARAAPPRPTVRRSTPAGLVVALVVTVIGMLIVGFELFMVHVFVGRGESCRANRGDAYQSCVRQEDLTELIAEGIAIGLSAAALATVLRSVRRGDARSSDVVVLVTSAGAALLALACIVLWVHGSQGGWAPTRPFPYEPVPTSWGHATMAIATVSGLLIGALVPLPRPRTNHPG